jgi:hypothetical protein
MHLHKHFCHAHTVYRLCCIKCSSRPAVEAAAQAQLYFNSTTASADRNPKELSSTCNQPLRARSV